MTRKHSLLFNRSDFVIHKLFWNSFWVMLAAELAVAVSNLIDSLMVSTFMRPKMFAALSLASPFFGLIAITSGLLSTGIQVVVSRHVIKAQFKEADHVFSISLFLGLIVALASSIVCFIFSDQIAMVFGAHPGDALLHNSTKEYLRGLSFGTVPLILNVILSPVLQINSDKTRVKITLFLIMGINFIFDALAIFVFDSGMFGIGLATSIAEWCGLVVYLLHFRKRNIMCHITIRGLRIKDLQEVLIKGLPKATVRICNALRPLLINHWILFLSTSAAISAVGINNNIRNFFRIPETAVALTIILIAGTFHGERDKESLEKAVKISMTYNVLINAVLAVAVLVFAPFLAAVYAESGTEIHAMSVYCLRWTACGLMFYAVNEYFVNFMLGIGRHKSVQIFAIFQRLIYAVVCAYVLGMLFGIKGVFASISIAEMCFTVHILIYVRVKSGKFPKKTEQFMLLPKNFGTKPEMTVDYSVFCIEDAIGISEKVMDFCVAKGVDQRRSYFAALCTEEMAANIVQYGFGSNKNQSLMIRVSYVDGDLILRFRDSCKLFNIREQYEYSDRKDITKNVGIRLVMRMAKNVTYVSSLSLNTTIIEI